MAKSWVTDVRKPMSSDGQIGVIGCCKLRLRLIADEIVSCIDLPTAYQHHSAYAMLRYLY